MEHLTHLCMKVSKYSSQILVFKKETFLPNFCYIWWFFKVEPGKYLSLEEIPCSVEPFFPDQNISFFTIHRWLWRCDLRPLDHLWFRLWFEPRMDGLSAHCNTGIRNSQTEKVNDAFHKFEASLGGKMNCLWEPWEHGNFWDENNRLVKLPILILWSKTCICLV